MGDGVVHGAREFLSFKPFEGIDNVPPFQTISMATPNATGLFFFRDDSGK